jgi:DNA-binding HxlR family transcriptional regulator
MLTNEQILAYRARTFGTTSSTLTRTIDQAVAFVQERGFISFWPIKGVLLPSLWTAVAGDRPVADAHNDPGHVTWDWKDKMLGKRRWYYGRVLRKKNSFLSLDMLPNFYALSPNYGEPEEDYLIDYEAGLLTAASKALYEALLREGPLDTIALRKKAGLTNQSANGEFNRALDELQTSFRILPVGVTDAGAWHYAFLYDLVPRHFPTLIEQAHDITEAQARQTILAYYLRSVGAVPYKEIQRVFGYQPTRWQPHVLERDLAALEQRGLIRRDVPVEDQPQPWIASVELFG